MSSAVDAHTATGARSGMRRPVVQRRKRRRDRHHYETAQPDQQTVFHLRHFGAQNGIPGSLFSPDVRDLGSDARDLGSETRDCGAQVGVHCLKVGLRRASQRFQVGLGRHLVVDHVHDHGATRSALRRSIPASSIAFASASRSLIPPVGFRLGSLQFNATRRDSMHHCRDPANAVDIRRPRSKFGWNPLWQRPGRLKA